MILSNPKFRHLYTESCSGYLLMAFPDHFKTPEQSVATKRKASAATDPLASSERVGK